MIIDSHSHYDDEAFDNDREEIIEGLTENGVEAVVSIGCDIKTTLKAKELSEKYPFIYFTAGFHPEYSENVDLDFLREISKEKKLVAIGEIGLDYHYDTPGREVQKKAFIKQMELASELNLPVCIHCRDAVGDVMEIVRKYPVKRGVFHCFSGSRETAEEALKLGYYISFSGTVTFKNAKNVKEVAAVVPYDRYMVETDCPYLSPEPNRGKRNDSKNIAHIIKAISELRNVSYEQVLKETHDNAKSFYGI